MRARSTWLAVPLSTLATLAACETPGLPERGTAYEFRLGPGDPIFRWPADRLPVRFYAEPVGSLRTYVALGLRRWEAQFLYREFDARMVDDSSTADVVVRFAGAPPPDASLTDDPPVAACDGVTSVPPTEPAADDVPTFADRLRITLQWFSGPTATDVANCLARITAHEIGHALGVFAHSPDDGDLMAIPVLVREPSARDRATIQFLYHLTPGIRPWSPPASP